MTIETTAGSFTTDRVTVNERNQLTTIIDGKLVALRDQHDSPEAALAYLRCCETPTGFFFL